MKGKAFVAALAILSAGTAPALAGAPIGEATDVARNAQVDDAGALRAISRGDSVAAEDTITTDGKGKAAFRFVDDTRLSVGPNSRVRLDKFVYDRDNRPSAFVIRASKGVLRFSTGRGDHDAYRIETPTATIGVRGTRFDVKIQGKDVRVSVSDGEVILCPNHGRADFIDCIAAAAGFSILSSATKARIVPTNLLKEIRAELLPLPELANALRDLPTILPRAGLPAVAPGGLQEDLPVPRRGAPSIDEAQQAVEEEQRLSRGAGDLGGAAGGLGGAAGGIGGAAGGIGGAAGGIGGAAGGLGGAVGGVGGVLGGVGGALPRIGR